uniref:B30.2/SPRY domain-containing protein n=2 Tax=Cynoglossus semilaevis TaxID=244447 RepID=A0A3P8WI22_CYNSE
MSLQVCSCCGWSKVTSYKGLRIHQGKMGCTPKEIKISKNLFGPSSYSPDFTSIGPTIQLQEPVKDIFPTSFTLDPSSDISLQTCYCGWSKLTTYHGLRTHQGKMGCTPNGTKISEFRFSLPPITFKESTIQLEEPTLDFFNTPVKSDSSSGVNLQVLGSCDSGFTTHQTHQKECILEDTKVLEEKVSNWRGLQVKTEAPSFLHTQNTQQFPADEVQTDSVETFFLTPQHSQQSTNNSANVRRALNFSTGAQQPKTKTVSEAFRHHTDEPTAQGLQRQQEVCGSARSEHLQVMDTGGRQRIGQPHNAQVFGWPPTTTVQEAAFGPKDMEQEAEKGRKDFKKAEMQQKILTREKMVAEVRSSLKNCKVLLDAQWVEVNDTFSEVIKVVEKARQKALQPLEERRRTVKREAQDLVEKLEKEINHLKKTIEDLDTNPDSQFSLDKYHERINVKLDTSFSFGSLKTTTSAMMEGIHQKLEKLSTVELRRFSKFTVEVNLDPLTAHQCLVLSYDGKRVKDGGKPKTLPATQERYDMYGSVIAVKSLTFGRSYWEVVVGNKPGWDLGVARGQAKRKGKISLNPNDGYWVIVHYETEKYAALTAPPISLSLREKPKKVGMFVDYMEGLVSFYNVTAKSHIYTFTGCSFSGEIFPYFSPHLNQDGENADPLIICP